MKAILEFDLPEDRSEFEIANKANDLHSALTDLYNEMRNCLKHTDGPIEREKIEYWKAIINGVLL
jgi:hypothetical protein